VFITVSEKNRIKSEGGGDPAKMIRMCLVSLFGQKNVEAEDFTAKGQRAGTKGIRDSVRSAILSELFALLYHFFHCCYCCF
jgi:hypothetical protein